MIDLYLIRHAESEMNLRPHLVGGRSNHAPLTKKGEEQAKLLGERLYHEKMHFDTVYSSIAVRASRTADIAANEISYPLERIVRCEELVEENQGDWEGTPRVEAYTPEVISQITKNNWEFKAPNGESQRDVEERMHKWFKTYVLDHYENASIAAFSHGISIKCFLRGVLDSSPKMTRMIDTENTSITHLKYDDGLWTIKTVNDYAHLHHMKCDNDQQGSFSASLFYPSMR